MRIAFLCEGMYDVSLMGYYIQKISKNKWRKIHDKEKKATALKSVKIASDFCGFAELYSNPEEVDEFLVIWPVNGKGNFNKAIENICRINTVYPEYMYDKVIVMADRDDDSIEGTLAEFSEYFHKGGWDDCRLQNNAVNKYRYITADGEENKMTVDVIPLVIPFDENGSMETVLLDSLASVNEENRFVVGGATTYIDGVCSDEKVASYLKKKGDQVKAKYSAVMAVMNPTHAHFAYDRILLDHDWEKNPVFEKHFGILKQII